jgi:hypothetical protein
MSAPDIHIMLYYRATHAESIEQRHSEFMANMARIGPPFGLAGMELPPVPDCGEELVAAYDVQYPIRGVWLQGFYTYRGESYRYEDRRCDDDTVFIPFKASHKALDYRAILYRHVPEIAQAFRAYRAMVSVGLHGVHYCDASERSNPAYNRLVADKTIDIDGRNNIYTLEPAQYWDAEVCRRALGYGPQEVIRRLRERALLVEPLMDGVYLVLNDNPNLTYEEFVAMNERFKTLLGLV